MGRPSSTAEAVEASTHRTTGVRGHRGKAEGAAREEVPVVREAGPGGASLGSRQIANGIGRGGLRENVYSVGGVVIGPEVKHFRPGQLRRNAVVFGSEGREGDER